jgi:hypothetical protein
MGDQSRQHGLTNDCTCALCLQETKTANHLLLTFAFLPITHIFGTRIWWMGCFKLAEKVSAQGLIHHASGHARHLDETQQ